MPDTIARVDGPDLDAIERDLAEAEQTLRRLDDGSYWTDEVTAEPTPDDEVAPDPIARRAPGGA